MAQPLPASDMAEDRDVSLVPDTSLVPRTVPAVSVIATEQDFDLALESIRNEPQPSLRYQMYERLAAYAESAQQMIDPLHEKLWATLKDDTEAWQKSGFTISDVESTFANLKLNAESARSRRQYREEAQRGLTSIGTSTQDWTTICPQDNPSESLLKIAARCGRALSAVPFSELEAVHIINHVVMLRRSAGKRGGARILGPSTTDYQKAREYTREKYEEIPAYTDEDFAKFNLRKNAYGLLEAMPTGQQGAMIGLLEPAPSGGQTSAQVWSTPGVDQTPETESSNQTQTPTPSGQKRHLSESPPEVTSLPRLQEQSEPIALPRRGKRVRYEEAASEASDDESASQYGEEDDHTTQSHPQSTARECGCGPEITEGFMKLITKQERKQSVLPTEAARMKLAQQFSDLTLVGTVICARHTKAAATSVGLRTRFTADILRARLTTYARSRSDSATLKIHLDTFNWFALSVRPRHPSEIRGVYKYDPPNAEGPTQFVPAVEEILMDLHQDSGEPISRTFDREGSVLLPTFTWWLTSEEDRQSIIEMAHVEFDMYYWHFRKEYGNSGSLGWLRNMYHSGIQQLMRQDPEYYRSYVALRPDHQWRLVSYPYYAKFSKRGDSTFFRHIDINVEQYLKDGRGGNMIQGSVSLDHETEDMCTEVLARMHTHDSMKDWHQRVAARMPDKRALGDWVSRVQDRKVWGPDDAKHFGTDFRPQPCPMGYARITSSLLPHGSTTMPDRDAVRRTMLPWLVGIQANHTDMEVLEMGTWQEISVAHVALDAAPRSPSGKPNVYGGIPYRFPASLPLIIPSPLSQALVGRTRWDIPDVMWERDTVLGKDTQKYQSWLKQWRRKATVAYRQHFLAVQRLEKELYGEKSFFFHRGDTNEAPPADTDMTEEIRQEINADIKKRNIPIEAHGQETTVDLEADEGEIARN